MPFSHGHALIVGVGADLPNTVDDAKGLAKILCDEARCAYPSRQVTLLTAAEATREKILDGLARIAKAATAESSVIFYFSGHGYRVESAGEATHYLMPYGYDLAQLAKTAIRDEEFTEALRKIESQKLLVLLDCCHAGGFEKTKAPGLALAKAPIPAKVEKILSAGEGRVVIASSRAHELSYAGEPYSAFTLALTEALCGVDVARKDGFVRVTDLTSYADKRVPELTEGKQHPVLHFEKADNFNVAYYAAGGQEPKGLPFKSVSIEREPGSGSYRSITLIGEVKGDYIRGETVVVNKNKNYIGKVEGDQYSVGRDATFNFGTKKNRPRRKRD